MHASWRLKHVKIIPVRSVARDLIVLDSCWTGKREQGNSARSGQAIFDCKLDCSITHQRKFLCLSQYSYRQICVHHKKTYTVDASKEEVCCGSNADGYKPLKRGSINDVVIGKWHTLLHCL